jgi:hypothetical protein
LQYTSRFLRVVFTEKNKYEKIYTCPRHHKRKLHTLFGDEGKDYILTVNSQREVFCQAMVLLSNTGNFEKVSYMLILDMGVKVLVVLFLQCIRQKKQGGRDKYTI